MTDNDNGSKTPASHGIWKNALENSEVVVAKASTENDGAIKVILGGEIGGHILDFDK